jgi:host factor-I protein
LSPESYNLEILREIIYGNREKLYEENRDMPSAGRGLNLQDNYLNQLRKEKISVIIYLTNGVRLKGVIKSFDNFVLLLKENTESLIYKHAISTIVPEREIDLRFEDQP